MNEYEDADMKTYMTFRTNIARGKPMTNGGGDSACPFCDRETIFREGVVIRQEDPFLLIENKFQTLDHAYQMVLIETDACDEDLSTYGKEHLHALLRFAIGQWEEIEKSRKYRSVILFKNHGVHSGGSIQHAHMQIVGLNDVDYREHVTEQDFEGYTIHRQPGVEFNLSKYPRAAFTEFNIVLSDMGAIDSMADYIQVAIHFILNHMNKRFQSYNIFFYRLAGKVMAKIVLRAPGSPYLMGYSIVQVPNNLEDVVQRVQSIYFTNIT